ncbi:MAG TPA: NPCBM/NEW2 domain-containing protein, partial [Tepidisphaeraceae bacterium]|nr:NPCBM/NEW2 domain-containing protein [Tepidisphaeraceae bacterium]
APAAAQVAVMPVAPTVYKRGLVLTTGTYLAQGEIGGADDSALRYSRGERRDVRVPLAGVARLHFRETGPDMMAKVPPGRAGVLLKNGDFVEGSLRKLSDRSIELSSVLFGLHKIDPGSTGAYALVCNDVAPANKAQFVVRAADGSVYFASAVRIEKNGWVVEDEVMGEFALSRTGVVEIAAGPGRLEPLARMRPHHVDLANVPAVAGRAAAGLSVDSTGAGVPMALGGAAVESGLTLPAGAAATWDLAGKYRTLTFRAGVPTGVAATAGVRFVVLVDGKEVYRSPVRTSLEQPVSAAVDVGGAKQVTLRVEPASPETAGMATPGLFAGAAVVR